MSTADEALGRAEELLAQPEREARRPRAARCGGRHRRRRRGRPHRRSRRPRQADRGGAHARADDRGCGRLTSFATPSRRISARSRSHPSSAVSRSRSDTRSRAGEADPPRALPRRRRSGGRRGRARAPRSRRRGARAHVLPRPRRSARARRRRGASRAPERARRFRGGGGAPGRRRAPGRGDPARALLRGSRQSRESSSTRRSG